MEPHLIEDHSTASGEVGVYEKSRHAGWFTMIDSEVW